MIVAKFIRGEFRYMDGGPFRVPQPTERRSASVRQSSSQRSSRVDVPSSRSKEETSSHKKGEALRPLPTSSGKRPLHRLLLPGAAVLTALLLGALGGWSAFSYFGQGGVPSVDAERYQAVSLANGQTYFGKLTPNKGGYVVLRDIYYLQEQAPQQSSGQASSSAAEATAQLTKRGEAVYGPDDEMVISKDQIFFIENLKKDSAVVKLIEEYQQSE